MKAQEWFYIAVQWRHACKSTWTTAFCCHQQIALPMFEVTTSGRQKVASQLGNADDEHSILKFLSSWTHHLRYVWVLAVPSAQQRGISINQSFKFLPASSGLVRCLAPRSAGAHHCALCLWQWHIIPSMIKPREETVKVTHMIDTYICICNTIELCTLPQRLQGDA